MAVKLFEVKPAARRGWKQTAPSGSSAEGQVDPAYGKMLMKTGYSGPVSLHLKYLEGNPKDAAVLKGFREAHVRDFATLKGWLGWV